MNEQQPRRWMSGAEGAPPELAAWLKAAERDLPDEAELAALGLLGPPAGLAGPEPSGPEPSGPATTGPATTGTTTTATVAKQASLTLAKWGTGVLLIGSGIWVATQTAQDPSLTPGEASGAQASSSALPVAPPPSSSALMLPQPSAPRAELEQEAVAPEPTGGRTGNTEPKETQPSRAEPSELSLLRAARAALARSPAEALRLTDEHARRFTGGRLVQEREVIRIRALERLGRTKEAESRQREFDERFPGSAHRRKLSQPHE